MASGVFILSIALHTWFAVVKGRSISNKIFYSWISIAWVFVYTMSTATVLAYPNVYVRAGAWVGPSRLQSTYGLLKSQCWVDRKYEAARLWLHYFWIFVCMFGTIVIYALMFAQSRPSTHVPPH